MKTKMIAAIAAASMFAGSAFAQSTGATGASGQNGSGPNIMSDMEQQMMDDNPGIASFFTDDTMSELRGDDEFKAAWDGMSEEDRSRLQGACDTPDMNDSNFSRGSLSLCAKVKAANAG